MFPSQDLDILTSMVLTTEIPRVVICFSAAIKTMRELMQGVLEYAKANGPWALHILAGRNLEQKLPDLVEWGCNGLIGNLSDEQFVDMKIPADIPLILNGRASNEDDRPVDYPSNTIGLIECDNVPIGRAAAEFFLSKGFTAFAYVGDVNRPQWSIRRGEVFARCVAARGFECHHYTLPPISVARNAVREQRTLARWLDALPKPIALFAANDTRARQVVNLCLENGIAVPQEISILSCDNDELLCESCVPSLSSIKMNPFQAGYEAASLLDRAMHEGFRRRHRPIRVTYTLDSIVSRLSTADLRVKDPLVERALTCIRLNSAADFSVGDLAEKLKVSRRLLEMRFRKVLDSTVHNAIMSARLERVCEVLKSTRLPIQDIADRLHFSSASHLGIIFKRQFGTTPSRFRRELSGGERNDFRLMAGDSTTVSRI
ncbi:MAG TPA: DNA-binding transcriptional regulator [Kiritimatiellia bacterium]|nr:DNA-binding transcriptional regulator [Kiritimatiellia bacterium]